MESIVNPSNCVRTGESYGYQESCGTSADIWCSCNGANSCSWFV